MRAVSPWMYVRDMETLTGYLEYCSFRQSGFWWGFWYNERSSY